MLFAFSGSEKYRLAFVDRRHVCAVRQNLARRKAGQIARNAIARRANEPLLQPCAIRRTSNFFRISPSPGYRY
jgi:hypothetical protein